jgi:peroxiredoxin Q/BCP
MPLQENIPAPDFALTDDQGVEQKLSDYRGKNVLLYFYPKDETPGCTTEACNFRDDYGKYENAGVTILGVSPDSVASHVKFKQKYHLPFALLSDSNHEVSEAYGVWKLKKQYGREYYGIARTSFLISPEGTIKKVFLNVQPAEHSAEVLAAL